MGLLTVPVSYFPYTMVAMDLLMAGPAAAAESIAGMIIGHLWWWGVFGGGLGSTGVLAQMTQAPQWLRNFFGEGGRPRPSVAGMGGNAAGLASGGVQVIPPRRVREQAQTTGHNWGSGQRLGSG